MIVWRCYCTAVTTDAASVIIPHHSAARSSHLPLTVVQTPGTDETTTQSQDRPMDYSVTTPRWTQPTDTTALNSNAATVSKGWRLYSMFEYATYIQRRISIVCGMHYHILGCPSVRPSVCSSFHMNVTAPEWNQHFLLPCCSASNIWWHHLVKILMKANVVIDNHHTRSLRKSWIGIQITFDY